MTHLTSDLDRICRSWCPMIGECPVEMFCKDMEEIKRRIIHIAIMDKRNE